jgi:hypothetical protein
MAKPTPSPSHQLEGFLRRFAPDVHMTATAALATLRKLVPGATEMVYDKANALVIGFAPGDRPSEAILSIALYTKWVNLYFLDGALLNDPERLLKGTGNRVRMIRLESPARLDSPAVEALIADAVENADVPFVRTRPRRLVIKSVAPAHRPRAAR